MDCEDEHVEEHDKYSFLLASAVRNNDDKQFFTVYDSIIPPDLPKTEVEAIKERARDLAGLPDDKFHDLALKARKFSLAQDRPKTMSSSNQSKESFFTASDAEDVPFIDDVEEDHEDDSTDDSRSPPNFCRSNIPPLIGLLKPPDLSDDLDQGGSDSGVFNISKATGTASQGSGSDKHDDSDSEGTYFDYYPDTKGKSAVSKKTVPAVNNRPYDEVHCVDSDSGSQLESPRSDTSLSSSVEGRPPVDVEMKTFKTCTRSYGSLDSDHNDIHKDLYSSSSSRNNYASMKTETQEDYEFDVSDLQEPVYERGKSTYGGILGNACRINKTPTSVDQTVTFPMFSFSSTKSSQASELPKLADKGSSTSRNLIGKGLDWRCIKSSLDDYSRTSSDSFYHFDPDDGKKKKKKKKGSKDDNDVHLVSHKDRSQIDENGNPISTDFLSPQSKLSYAFMRDLHVTRQPFHSAASKTYGQTDSKADTNTLRALGATNSEEKRKKKKANEKEIQHPKFEEGYIGDKPLDFILQALGQNEKGSKPKKVPNGQKDTMGLPNSSKVDKPETPNVKNSKSEKKQKSNPAVTVSDVICTATLLKDFPSKDEDSLLSNEPTKREPTHLYNYVRLKDNPFPHSNGMGASNVHVKSDSGNLEEVIVQKPENKKDANVSSDPDKSDTLLEEMTNDLPEVNNAESVNISSNDLENGQSSGENHMGENEYRSTEEQNSLSNAQKLQTNQRLCDEIDNSSKVKKDSGLKATSVVSKHMAVNSADNDIKKTCDNLELIEVKADLQDTGPKCNNYVPGDFYIFTDVEIPPVDRDAEFCPVVHKKKKRGTAKDFANNVKCSGGGYHSFHKSRTSNTLPESPLPYRHHAIRKFTRSVTPPPTSKSVDNQKLRDLSPSAFPALRHTNANKGKSAVMEGRRNSTGDVSMEANIIRAHDDSDIESVKSLPVASQTGDSSPGINRQVISYAKIAASPKPHSCSPLSPVSVGHSDMSGEDSTPTRQQTVWKGNVRERRHSLGSSPDTVGEDGKLTDAYRQKSGSQEVLAGESSPEKAVCNPTPVNNVRVESKPNPTSSQSVKGATVSKLRYESECPIVPKGEKLVNSHSSVSSSLNEPMSFRVDSVLNTGTHQKAAKGEIPSESVNMYSSKICTPQSDSGTKGHNPGSLNSATAAKSSKMNSMSSPVLRQPQNNGKKGKRSVIFLDRRLAGPPQDLGITFGFEPELEGSTNSIPVSLNEGDKGNVVSVLPKASARPKNGPREPQITAKTSNTELNGKPLIPAKQTQTHNMPLRSLPHVHNNVKSSLVCDSVTTASSTAEPNSESPKEKANEARLTKPTDKGVYRVSTVNGLVMPLVLEDKAASTLEGSTTLKATDSAIIYSSSSCVNPNPSVSTATGNPIPRGLDEDNTLPQSDTSTAVHSSLSLSSVDSVELPSCTCVSVVYGSSIPTISLSSSSLSDSCEKSSFQDTCIMTSDSTTETNGPLHLTQFKMEEISKGKFNWEEAARFLKKEWDKIITQKERKPDTVLMFSCNTPC